MKRLELTGRRERRLLLGMIALVVALAFAARSYAGAPSTLDSTNRAFAEGHYTEAAAGFEQLVAKEGYSAPLLFDLGNAYLRDGRPSRAMLAYERAQLLAPRDEAIASNLAVARAAASTTDDRSTVGRLARALPMSGWAWLAAGGFWIAVSALAVTFVSKRRRSWMTALSTAAAITAGASSAALAIASRDLDRGLVMESAPVLVSPFASAQSDFALPAGSDVELGRTRDGYVFIHDPRGRSGWIERAQLERLIPPST
jgi:tetratricopeptide (TPR) repeat protein